MTRFLPLEAPVLRFQDTNRQPIALITPGDCPNLLSPKLPTQEQFQARIEHEFVLGSGISLELFADTIHIVSDLQVAIAGEVETPIHIALNWLRFVRFGYQVNPVLFAALLVNEDGSTWQAKLSTPKFDSKKGKSRKYEAPLGNGSRAFFPRVPSSVRQRIARRYGVEVPLTGSFWDWVATQRELPVIWTEGGKKALSLLSQGYIAISLYGVYGGYRKQVDGDRVLIEDVLRFTQPGRSHYFAFDQDSKADTRRKVNVALLRFGELLEKAQGHCFVLEWNGTDGKGVDDLIVNQGVAAFDAAYHSARSLLHWKLWQRLEHQLTYPAQMKLQTTDLSTLNAADFPKEGLLFLLSPKASGKTKLIHHLVSDQEVVLSATHRIALGRNLCARLGLNWKGDIDKVGSDFITHTGYTLKVGFCVDSLLAINPEKFAGCDLILDEAVQVIQHLLASATCAKDGKRPALLARFEELVRIARRVIAADADLDNGTVAYLRQLRGNLEPAFLVRNDCPVSGYDVRFIIAPDRTPIVQEILESVRHNALGKVIFIATDSKGMSKAIAALIQQQYPEKRLLVINSETSGGEAERNFLKAPDRLLQGPKGPDYDVIIASPSMATGISIETLGVITKVFGVFMGGSATDRDMSQSLVRVRELVERVVWCAKVGSNYSPVSRSASPAVLKHHLQQSTSATVRLVRSNLREDVAGMVEQYNWHNNPHLDLYCKMSAAQNFAMSHLREALLVRLQFEGHRVILETQTSNPAMKAILKGVKEAQKIMDAEDIVAAEDLTYSEVLQIEQQEAVAPEEAIAITKYYLKDFYELDSLSLEDVLWDNNGRRRQQLVALEVQQEPELASERVVKHLDKQMTWNKGLCPWDVYTLKLKQTMRQALDFDELIAKIQQGWEWTSYDLKPYATKARALAEQIKVALRFSIHDGVSDVQIIHELLLQLSIKVVQARWSQFVPGHEGEKLRVYQMDREHCQRVTEVLGRRKMKRSEVTETRSPRSFNVVSSAGDLLITAHVELLTDAMNYGQEAVLELFQGMDTSLRAETAARLPQRVRSLIQQGLKTESLSFFSREESSVS